jgi:hypothetical protein
VVAPDWSLLGLDRLRHAVETTRGSAKRTGEAVVTAIRTFAAGRRQPSDLTLVAFGRKPTTSQLASIGSTINACHELAEGRRRKGYQAGTGCAKTEGSGLQISNLLDDQKTYGRP